jgi:glycine cleavage system H protein
MESVHYYKRSRFSTRLPQDRRYTASHYWLAEEEVGVWRVGWTKFATRMLGDLVEFGFEVPAGSAIEIGAKIGWVEGFKAVADLYSVVTGDLVGVNPDLDGDITLADTDPYGRGWLYRARGAPDPGTTGVEGYVAVLDATIDKMLASRHDGGEDG